MAKPRKPKASDEAKPDNYGAVVRHQKLCLSIDLDNRRIHGYTEIEISVPEIGIVALHADNLGIESVSVDGEPADFEYYPRTYYHDTEYESRWGYEFTPSSAADAAGMVYGHSVKNESEPTLLVSCCKGIKPGNEQEEQMASENGVQQSSGERESKQNVRLLRVNYWVETVGSGIHINGNVLHTDNQIRRARCWFPCVDDTSQRCCYDLEFTVAQNLVAVSTGSLLYQVLSRDDPPRKTYVYKVDVPVSSQWISLAVGPFEVLPDQQFCLISHMCLPANLPKLRNTVEFFHSAFSCYKDYLSVNFPFGSYKQVFIEPQMTVSSLSLGASISIFSSQILFDEKIIDQTIDTRIKLAYALAKQWFGVYITPETPNDEWLLDGLAGFLTDLFIKKYLGNNEARYRRYKANCAVCKADDSGATSLSSSASSKDLYGTQAIGVYGKIRSWKSVAVLQMLEKQMGPESFKKILQTIVSRAEDKSRPLRSLSTKEFRHFANKVGNLERPFLKDFFPRWVESCGCPMLRMGFSYNKRKNMIELAVLRGCTAAPDAIASIVNKTDSENKEGDSGWPGMMSIRVYELDGTFDHPVLPMSGDACHLVEIQCHSKLAARRFQKPKKALKPDGSDENGDGTPALDSRPSMESPLLWMRADPEMEYLAKIHFNQPLQMWINQLEKDKDVIAQAQAIVTLESSPQISFCIVTALNNFLNDSKVFWRVRIEAAFALAKTASEETDWAGLLHLVKFYKSRRFDAEIGLPKPNDFHDFAEYFVLEAIPHAISMVRTADGKSPREAVEFVLQLLKYNDNNGNPYSDVYWLAALIQSVGELEFGQQSILFLASLLKRIDRLLQFDRLMPSHNGILTVSCIRSLTQIALKLSGSVPLDRIVELVKPFRDHKTMWQVRIEASRALLDLEFHGSGIDAALSLFIHYVEEESSLRGQVKLAMHAMRLCRTRGVSDSNADIKSQTLVALLRLLEGRISFSNVILRHLLFCILQILGGRPSTLYGIPRDSRPFNIGVTEAWQEQKNMFGSFVSEINPPSDSQNLSHDNNFAVPEASKAVFPAPEATENEAVLEASQNCLTVPEELDRAVPVEPDHAVPEEAFIIPLPVPEAFLDGLAVKETSMDSLALAAPEASRDGLAVTSESSKDALAAPGSSKDRTSAPEPSKDGLAVSESSKDGFTIPEPSKETDTVSTSHGRKRPVVKIRMKRSAAMSRAEEPDNQTADRSHGGGTASSSVSVDAPQRNNFAEAVSVSNHNIEEVNSYHDLGSRMTASIGSAKLASDDLGKELQCTADSSKVTVQPQPDDPSSSSFVRDNNSMVAGAQKFASLHDLSGTRHEIKGEKKDKKKDKEKKRKRDDPEYAERKRLKKEKKKKEKEKEKSKLMTEAKMSSVVELTNEKEEIENKEITTQTRQIESDVLKTISGVESKPMAAKEVPPAVPKFRIKIKKQNA